MDVVLALAAALLFAIGTVIQQTVAAQASDEEAMRAGFLLKLARQPVWLGGIAVDALYRRLSMNFAAWGRLFAEDAELSLPERALRRVAIWLNPFFQIKSLRDFNEKFQPEWLPRSIVVEDPAAMAKVGVLYASVEGFLNLPVVGRYLVPYVRSYGGRRDAAAPTASGAE